MGEDNQPSRGADLKIGIPGTQVTEGRSIAGHVGDDAVIVTRSNGRCFATGATCSHWHGPLAEGIVVDGTVRCPWHHAAFRLDNGEAVRPPALDSLPCWQVEELNGVIRVLDRIDRMPGSRRKASGNAPESVVIIGAGAAGIAAAQTLRTEGYQGRITMVDADPDAPVDRPNLSKDYLAGTAQEEWVELRSADFFLTNEITFMRTRRVVDLDVAGRGAILDDGSRLPFGALLLATGASPIVLPLPNPARLPIFTLRSLADSRAIIKAAEHATPGSQVVVLGASFIGLEVAASLRTRGFEVHVVAPETRPLERVMGTEIGDWIHRIHLDHGVVFHLGQKPRELVDGGVRLESGERVPASFVVAGVGVRPNVELAERAGLHIDRGVLVDAQLRTSVDAIFAAGDVARYPDARTDEHIRVEHWVAAQRQAQTAARNILGAGEPFTAVPFFWSAHYDTTINYVGHAEKWDSIEIGGSLQQNDCTVRYLSGERTLAVATIGRDFANLEAELSMERETTAAAVVGSAS
jgi:NADPH-dependent 2,4-dienoyl-CoA reductase/sulfur reductase-like enzyme/nitrite reductase/ring-hydroxylating ferredoxin subunit